MLTHCCAERARRKTVQQDEANRRALWSSGEEEPCPIFMLQRDAKGKKDRTKTAKGSLRAVEAQTRQSVLQGGPEA